MWHLKLASKGYSIWDPEVGGMENSANPPSIFLFFPASLQPHFCGMSGSNKCPTANYLLQLRHLPDKLSAKEWLLIAPPWHQQQVFVRLNGTYSITIINYKR